MKKQSSSMQYQLHRSGAGGYALKPNNLNYIIGGSCIPGGVILYLLMTVAEYNAGIQLFCKAALVIIWEVVGLWLIYRNYKFRVTVTGDGINITKALGGSQYYAWSQIAGAEERVKQGTVYLDLYSAQGKICAVNRSCDNYGKLTSDLTDRGLL